MAAGFVSDIYSRRFGYRPHIRLTVFQRTQDHSQTVLTVQTVRHTKAIYTVRMQVTLVLSSLLLAAAVVSAYPQSPESRAVIVAQEIAVNLDGTFTNKFQTNNGIRQEEVGYLKAGPDGQPISVVQGGVAYVAPDGSNINTGYIADENGYRPYGAHLPTPPPIPAEIQESLKLLASLPSTPEPQYQ